MNMNVLFVVFLAPLYCYLVAGETIGNTLKEINLKSDGEWRAVQHEKFAQLKESELKRFVGVRDDKHGKPNPEDQPGLDKSISAFGTSPSKQHDQNGDVIQNDGSDQNGEDDQNGGSDQNDEGDQNDGSDQNGEGDQNDADNQNGNTCKYNTEFDARAQWSNCAPIIGSINDQAQCGCCWAMATADVYSDRKCIQRSKANQNVVTSDARYWFSALDLMSCSTGSYGCNGGYPNKAWSWIVSNGISSGSNFTTKSGCKPYPFDPYAGPQATPKCSLRCTNQAFGTKLERQNGKASGYQYWYGKNGLESAIQNEMRANGSVVATMDVYEDFYHYLDGVYKHTSNSKYLGGHGVRLIGWGTKKCTNGISQPYWIAANSWNTWWGQNGFFLIARGTNECRIESNGIAFGYPIL